MLQQLILMGDTDKTFDFSYKNVFTPSDKFEMLDKISLDAVTLDLVIERMNAGLPLVVSHVTHNWKANEKWDHKYFEKLFGGSELFSSTFSTLSAPEFFVNQSMKEIYFGAFCKLFQSSYQYPSFILVEWRIVD